MLCLEGGALARGEGRTLVFAGDVAAANDVAGILTEAGLQPLVYHKGVSQADRESALATMRTRQAPTPHTRLLSPAAAANKE